MTLGLSTILIIIPESKPDFMELTCFDYQPLLLYILTIAWGMGIFIFILQKYIL